MANSFCDMYSGVDTIKENIKAFEFIKSIPFLPNSAERGQMGRPGNQEIKRWLQSGSVIINNSTPKPNEEVEFPIIKLIFFPKGSRRTTYLDV